MPQHFISLKCSNCGGKLDVFDEMERFACRYCGTEMVVQRQGGTVALKAITEAIQQLRTGAEKTAAELALVRLQRESIDLEDRLSALRAKAARLSVALPPSEEPQGWPWMSSTIFLVFAAAAFFPSVARFGVVTTMVGILVLTFLTAGLSVVAKRDQRKQREAFEGWTRSKQGLDAGIETVTRASAGRDRDIANLRRIV